MRWHLDTILNIQNKDKFVNVKEVIFQTKEMSVVLQKLILLTSPGFHQGLFLTPWFSCVWKACLISCRITDTLLISLGTVPGNALGGWWSHGRALSCPKQHLHKQLWTCCPRALKKSPLPAPLLFLPGESGSVQCTCTHQAMPSSTIHWVVPALPHCWAAPEMLAQTTCNPGSTGAGHAGTCTRQWYCTFAFQSTQKGPKEERKTRNQYKRKEWSNEQHICDNLQRQRTFRFCWVFPLVNVSPSDLFKKWCCDG